MYDIEGRVAVVTGGASGMGRAIVNLLVAFGADVIVADIDEKGGETVAAGVEGPGRARFQRCDVSCEADAAALVDAAVREFGGLDMAFNNAGIDGPAQPLIEQTEDIFRKIFEVNLLGVFFGIKYQVPAMIARGGGGIVNTASIAGLRGHPGIGCYSASKHGVNGMTKTAAIEYGPQNVRVNSICPGGIRTPMLDQYLESAPELRARIIDQNPMQRLGEAHEMAQAAVWLASPAASYVNGQTIAVDGGKICSDV